MMDPTDVLDGCRLYRGDCLDVLRSLPDGAVDAVVTDPPFGINYASGFSPACTWHDKAVEGDESTASRDAVVRWASERNLPWACFGSWKVSRPDGTRGALVWDKGPAFGMGDLSFPWKPSWELIFVGGPGWKGTRDEGVLRGPVMVSWESKGRVHQNQKPTWLMSALLKKLPRGLTILDPFMGSGSTGIAALQMGYKFIGIELDPAHYATALRRLTHATGAGPGQLFAGVLA